MGLLLRKPTNNNAAWVIILCDQHAFIIQRPSQTVQKIKLSKLQHTIQSHPQTPKIYWILLNSSYQILPHKNRLGSSLKLSEDTEKTITECSPTSNLKENVFAFEQILSLSTDCTISLSPQITRHIKVHRLRGIISSRLFASSPIASTHSSPNVVELSVDDVIEQLTAKMQKNSLSLFHKAAWRVFINRLFLAEPVLFLLLVLLTPPSFFLEKPPPTKQHIIKPPPAKPLPQIWHFSQLSQHLTNISLSISPLKNIFIQKIEFQAPSLTLSGYLQDGLSKQNIQKEWQQLLMTFNQNPHIKATQVLRNPLQGNLSQRRMFRIQLLLLNRP